MEQLYTNQNKPYHATPFFSEEELTQIKRALRAALSFLDIYGYRVDPEWAEEVERNCAKALSIINRLP